MTHIDESVGRLIGREDWRTQLVPDGDARFDQLATLARDLAEATSTEVRAQVRDLLEEAVLVNTRALAGFAGLSPESRRRVRAAGVALAGELPTDTVIAQLGKLTSAALVRAAQRGDDPAPLVVAGNQLVRDYLAGVGGSGEAEAAVRTADSTAALARSVLAGAAATEHLAATYLIVVLDFADDLTARLTDVLAEYGPGVLVAPVPTGAVVLLPGGGALAEKWVVDRLGAGLDGRAWGAVTTRDAPEVPAGHDEAMRVLALARAADSPPGVYRRSDFLLEYAAARHDGVADDLVEIITPVMASTVLRTTLDALIRADFNRSRAAKALFVHRSTLDYRLRRIEEITGCNPVTVRGSQVLNVAVTVYLLRRDGGPTGEEEVR